MSDTEPKWSGAIALRRFVEVKKREERTVGFVVPCYVERLSADGPFRLDDDKLTIRAGYVEVVLQLTERSDFAARILAAAAELGAGGRCRLHIELRPEGVE
jgi:hypothetical protein